jgi:hypothetical protein
MLLRGLDLRLQDFVYFFGAWLWSFFHMLIHQDNVFKLLYHKERRNII